MINLPLVQVLEQMPKFLSAFALTRLGCPAGPYGTCRIPKFLQNPFGLPIEVGTVSS